jgi:NADH-quinone oxidoreductase subunit L
MEVLLWAAVAVPAALALVARVAGSASGPVAALSAFAALVPVTALLIAAGGGETAQSAFVWLPAVDLELGLRLDGLSAAVSTLVAAVGLVTLLYAHGYFADAERAPQAQAALLAFLAAMQGLVLAANFLTLLIFWEIVGALSMRLIAYERDDPRAPGGAVRAFLTTRTADAGLYVAVAALFAGSGSLGFDTARPDGLLGAAVGVGLILAAAGKSAQLPFQSWLSGAMAGPTPVSALLHSATMVAAGVYLLVRAEPVLAGWPLELAGWLGAITAVVAAGFALGQRDLKLVLASSTTSQLGLMFVAAATVPAVAIFQLICHAAGKAGAFLAAGIFQRRRGTTSLVELAGVGRQERAAFWGFTLSAASIAAVPPLAMFWSKEAILAAAEEHGAWVALVALASIGTAAYMLRPVLLLWRPAGRSGERPAGRVWMLVAIAMLGIGSLVLGGLGTPLGELLGERIPPPSALAVGLSLAALLAGVGLIVARLRPDRRLAVAAERQLGTDEGLRVLVQRPMISLAAAADRADRAIDRLVDAIGRATLGAARRSNRLDGAAVDRGTDAIGRGTVGVAGESDRLGRRGIDAAVDGLARLVARGGAELPRLQSGQLYQYLRNTVLGIAVLAAVFAVVAIA